MVLVVAVLLVLRVGTAVAAIKPLFFAGMPADRFWNRTEEQLVLRHAMAVVGAGGRTQGPAERAMHEQVRRLQAAAVASNRAAPPMYVYRNGLEALPGFEAIDRAFANHSLDFLWVRNGSALGQPIVKKPQPGLGGFSRFFDWRKPAVAKWFAEQIVAEVAAEEGIAGVFFDEADWASCGSGTPEQFMQASCDPGWSAADTLAFAHGQLKGWVAAQKALARTGKQISLSLFTFRGANGRAMDNRSCAFDQEEYFRQLQLPTDAVVRPYLDVLWFGPDPTAAQCDNYLRNMIEDADAGTTILTRGVLPNEGTPQSRLGIARAASAAILLADNNKTFVGLSSGWDTPDVQWWPFYSAAIGSPTGPAQVDRNHMWRRNFTGGHIYFDCQARPFAGDLVLHPSPLAIAGSHSVAANAWTFHVPVPTATDLVPSLQTVLDDISRLRAERLTDAGTSPQVSVVLDPGVHVLLEPLRLGYQHSNMVLEGHGTAVVSGGVRVTGWEPSQTETGVLVAPAPSSLPEGRRPRQLYVDGSRVNRTANSPADERVMLSNASGARVLDTGLVTPSLSPLRWPDPSGVELKKDGWFTQSRCGVAGVQQLAAGAGTLVEMQQPCCACQGIFWSFSFGVDWSGSA